MSFNNFGNQFKSVGPTAIKAAVAGGAALFGGVYFFNNGLYNIEAGQRGIKFNRISGVGNTVYAEGTHVMIPWFERPIVFDVRSKPRTIVSLTGSKDLQMVNISLRTLVRPHEGFLPQIYRRLGVDFDEKVLPSIINEVLKSVVAQFNASQLITQREDVSRRIRAELTQRAAEFNIVLDDVSIIHLSFSPEYEKAVESKQVAQQDAEKARYMVVKAHEEKKNMIIRAQGDMEAAEMVGEAIQQNPAYLQLRQIDAARQVASCIANARNRVVLNSDALLLNLRSEHTITSKVQE